MGSTGNPNDNNNPWSQYDSYKDCSQGVCSVYCPQWCYVIFPPPPSFFLDDSSSSSSSDFSPLLIALIGILASAFILVSYYTLISKYCHRRRLVSSVTNREVSVVDPWQGSNNPNPNPNPVSGLDESLIKAIKVYKYKKSDGLVLSLDCSVCLSEFEEKESLRLLPKCNHAFHLPCIDTWLKSHSNCPLCRSSIDSVITTTTTTNVTESESVSTSEDAVVVVDLDLDTTTRSEVEKEEEEEEVNRRSVVLISDILMEIDEEEDDVGTSSFLVAMKRSVSNGKFVVSSRNYRLPN